MLFIETCVFLTVYTVTRAVLGVVLLVDEFYELPPFDARRYIRGAPKCTPDKERVSHVQHGLHRQP